MANGLFPLGRSAILDAGLDWVADTIRVQLLDATLDEATRAPMEFADELTGLLGTATALTGKAVLADGIADADDVSYPDVGIGETVLAFVLYKWTGSLATSRLIYYADENDDTTSFSLAGDGADIPITWSESPYRVFRI